MEKIMLITEFQTKAGYKAAIAKMPLGHLCGYVGIPKSHPLYGKGYSQHCDSLMKLRDKAKEGQIGKRGIVPVFCWDGETASMDVVFNVHGGVTFSETSDKYPIENDKRELHWIGFDCAHADDTPEKCNLKYCVDECESLSEQIKCVEDE